MQVSYIWSKFHLYRYKVVVASLLLALCCLAQVSTVQAQQKRWVQRNNPNYDSKKLTYGFLIALHSSTFKTKYSDAFVTQQFDTVYSVNPMWTSGFTLGFIVNHRVTDYLDVRLTPQVAFYENKVRYLYTNETFKDATVESTIVEFPVLLKYKSERRGNIRMYMVGGLKPAIQASGKKQQAKEELEIKSANLSIEAGFGFDLYYPLFKFSPEVRFSHGMLDMLGNRTNSYGQPLSRVSTNMVTVYFLFQ
ncbi:outer membrane beta-barrel protein [Chryseolinea sp. T2]|uniref:type IX secretion/gliding motility protein PorT/SprT n=1 Tax=Chryseolinea sp. T2 TaxID=3129255 RepID=UPI0030774C56